MKLGADRNRVVILGLVIAVAGYFFYTNVLSDSSGAPPRPQGAVASSNNAANNIINPPAAARGPVVRGSSRTKSSDEFHPSMKRKPEDALDPTSIDPRIRLDLLAKVQSVELDIAGRNPFQFGQPPPPPPPKDVPKVDPQKLREAMNAQTPAKPAPPAGPPPLNLSWKYFGYTSAHGSVQKKAFFLDGEEILTATEGEVLKRKFRVVRIGVNSVVVEDTDTKSQQNLPLQEEVLG
jgi:hypothetical protein